MPRPQRIDPAKTAAARINDSKYTSRSRKSGVRKATVGDWIGAARLRTLTLAISPVVLGTACAFLVEYGLFHWLRALLCLVVAVSLQIGVNYANDYSDGIRGTDRYRVGPPRLTASGAVKPRIVLIVALTFFAVAAITGSALVIRTGQYWLFAVGLAAIIAAYFYTGGKRPYGYYALGEVAVFVFFGIVATAGTAYVQVNTVTIEGWLAGAAAGFIACAVLMVNNIRDLDSDRVAGKKTLAVVVGDRAARVLFAVFLAVPYVILVFFVIFYPTTTIVYLTLLVAVPAALIGLTGKTAPELVLALKLTSLTALLFALALAGTVLVV